MSDVFMDRPVRVRVYLDGLDWMAECEEHNEVIWCDGWLGALEAAYGHAAMWHPRNLDTSRPQEDA